MSGLLARVRGHERSAAWAELEGHASDSVALLLIEVRVERCEWSVSMVGLLARLMGRLWAVVTREVSGGSGGVALVVGGCFCCRQISHKAIR